MRGAPRMRALEGRVFLMLQGPQSVFFKELSRCLTSRGARILKVQLCGGDVFLWNFCSRRVKSGAQQLLFRGRSSEWIQYVAALIDEEQVSDLLVYSDWRPLHQDAILIAKSRGVKVWVFEEGYLRRGYSTLEQGGVNGRSSMPMTSTELVAEASELPPFEVAPSPPPNPIRTKVLYAIYHHMGNVILYFLFPHYHTHRPHNIFVELIGILPRYLMRGRRKLRSARALSSFLRKNTPFFFYPLQLNSDSQIQLYSPYIRQEEAITHVIASFARRAPKDARLLIKNHPLDNGLTPYRSFITNIAEALGVGHRVTYVEDGNLKPLIRRSCGVVLINSTVGLTALLEHKPVFCLGMSIYNLPGLAQSVRDSSLDDFWEHTIPPNKYMLQAFCRLLNQRALIRGNFYGELGREYACADAAARFAGEQGLKTVFLGHSRHSLRMLKRSAPGLQGTGYAAGAAGGTAASSADTGEDTGRSHE